MNGNDTGNSDTAHLPAAQAEGRPVGIGFIIEPDKLHGFFDPIFYFVITKAEITGAKGDVFGDGFFKELIFRILENHPHFVAHLHGFFCFLADVHAIDRNRSLCRLQQSVQELDQRRFP